MAKLKWVLLAVLQLIATSWSVPLSGHPTPMSDVEFPFLFDVGGSAMPPVIPSLEGAIPRMQFGKIFECPHPCGLLPSYNPDAKTPIINGGIPQLANLTLHLDTLNQTFEKFIEVNDSRWIDLDFESWNPVWERNSADGYTHNASIELVLQQHPTWTNKTQIEAEAKAQFEAAAGSLLIETVQFTRHLRPLLKIGMYGFPTRYYWNGYNSTDGDLLRAQNDGLYALWCELDGLFPSVYQFYNSCNASSPTVRINNEQYVYSNVAEAVRLAAGVPGKCPGRSSPPPVFVYTWACYHQGPPFLLCDADLEMFWVQSHAAGATGLVLWGSRTSPELANRFANWYVNDFAPLANAWQP